MDHPIRTLREAIGLSQGDFGQRIGRSQAVVSRLECGEDEVSREVGLRIMDEFREECFRLGITLEAVLRGHPVALR